MTDHREDWESWFVLPNVHVEEPVQTDLVALVSPRDERMLKLVEAHSNLRELLGRFSDPFGVRVEPAVILVRRDAPKTFRTIEAIGSFRDVVALSVIPLARAKSLLRARAFSGQYSDWFELYPWMLDKNYKHLISSTIASMSLHSVSEFQGQCDPTLSPITLDRLALDLPLLNELLVRWKRRYRSRSRSWSDIALFRSLEMATAASKMPARSDLTIYGLGRSIGLWVSAFETLVHPGTSHSGLTKVYELLEKTPWLQRKSEYRRYRAYMTRNPTRQRTAPKRNLACWIYGEIHHARNDFLHGNPITTRRLRVRRSDRSLFQYAAPLYRMALTGFLPLPRPPWPRNNGSTTMSRTERDAFDFEMRQREIEGSLHTILAPVDSDDD